MLEELIERLKNSSRYEQAAELILTQPGFKVESVVDCYLKANRFLKAY
jgi:hypothetical protein